MNDEELESVMTENLDEALEQFRVEICRALMSVPLKDIKYVDIIFHKSASGVLPKFKIRRVLERSDVHSQDLHNNVERIIRYDADKLKQAREQTNNE